MEKIWKEKLIEGLKIKYVPPHAQLVECSKIGRKWAKNIEESYERKENKERSGISA